MRSESVWKRKSFEQRWRMCGLFISTRRDARVTALLFKHQMREARNLEPSEAAERSDMDVRVTIQSYEKHTVVVGVAEERGRTS
jgi:hypothetical protein